MKKVFIWNKGDKKGQVYKQDYDIPDFLEVVRFPLVPDAKVFHFPDFALEPPTQTTCVMCKKTEFEVEGKRVYLCEEE